jgi:Subtilase family.
MLINLVAALALLTPVQAAATVSQKILLPVVVERPLPGALGSLWSSQVEMYYGGDLPGPFVEGTAIPCYFDPCRFGQRLAAGTTYPDVTSTTATTATSTRSGTSYSAPIVAGIIARLQQRYGAMSPLAAWNALQNSSAYPSTAIEPSGVNNKMVARIFGQASCSPEYP